MTTPPLIPLSRGSQPVTTPIRAGWGHVGMSKQCADRASAPCMGTSYPSAARLAVLAFRRGYGHAMFLPQMTGSSQTAGHPTDGDCFISCMQRPDQAVSCGCRSWDDRGFLLPVPLVIFHPFPRGSEATQGRVSAVGTKWTSVLKETTRRPTRGWIRLAVEFPTTSCAFDLGTCRWIGASHVTGDHHMLNRTSKRARWLGDAGNAASVVFISTLAVEDASQNVLGERVEALKTDVAVNEALDVLVAARRIVSECELALADGEVTPEEARSIMHRAQDALREAQESVQASEDAFHADRAVDAIRRGDGDYSPHRLKLLAGVGLTAIDAPDNVRQFPERDDAPVAG